MKQWLCKLKIEDLDGAVCLEIEVVADAVVTPVKGG